MNKPVIVTEETLTTPVVVEAATPSAAASAATGPAYAVLFAISVSHLLNDLMQSLIPSIYPILKANYALDYTQIGLISLAFQFTSSLLQPVVGFYTDRKPMPYSLAVGMGFTLAGLLLLASAQQYAVILLAAAIIGTGSAIFHPESARIARLASGGRYGFAQSVFQVGGNFGSAAGPLLAALIVVPFGQGSVAWFSAVAALAMLILWRIGSWYKPRIVVRKAAQALKDVVNLPPGRVRIALAVLVALMFSKAFYTASISSYYTFYLIEKFGVTTSTAQILLFVFLGANVVGVYFGGPLGDRFGRKRVLWFSVLGALPFTLLLPYADLTWSVVLTVMIGLIMASATPAIIVFAQELMPHRFGLISGIFYGLAFGLGGIGAALLGKLADLTSLDTVYSVCAVLPAIGLLAVFLPRMKAERA
ncbi:MAG: Fosmidomycin resistance protein [Proteobacteria bacterium SG_bin9]|nr:MAG: Fosmidomycin resistance protein [Proteobacteria bacterium SG_bin9]